MATARERARSRERLDRLSDSRLDSESIRREAIAELQRVIGFDRWCWPLADPETLLPSGGIAEHDFGPGVPRALEPEYSRDEFAAKHVLARRANSVGSLSTETGGDLARSPRWDEAMRPVGIGDVAAVACRDALGCWGWIEAYRNRADRPFEEDDLDLLTKVGPKLGAWAALRRTSMDGGVQGVRRAEPGGRDRARRRPQARQLDGGGTRLDPGPAGSQVTPAVRDPPGGGVPRRGACAIAHRSYAPSTGAG